MDGTTLMPVGDLTTLEGFTYGGDWTLNVTDATAGNPGMIMEWVVFTDVCGSDPIAATGQDLVIAAVDIANDSYTVRNVSAGDVTIAIEGRLTNGSGGMEGNPDEQVGVANVSISFQRVPEPGSIVLLLGGAFGLMMAGRRRR